MIKATFIFGEICSGKSTFIKEKIEGSYKLIELGQLVRDLYKTEERIFDANLDDYLSEKVLEMKERDEHHSRGIDHYVIAGCRQVSLLKKLEKHFSDIERVYLKVPRDILRRRFSHRDAIKDRSSDFDNVIAGDVALGIDELKLYLLNEVDCIIINNY